MVAEDKHRPELATLSVERSYYTDDGGRLTAEIV